MTAHIEFYAVIFIQDLQEPKILNGVCNQNDLWTIYIEIFYLIVLNRNARHLRIF